MGFLFKQNVPFRRVREEEVDTELMEKMGKNAFVYKVNFCFKIEISILMIESFFVQLV